MSAVGLYKSSKVFLIQNCPLEAHESAYPLYMYLHTDAMHIYIILHTYTHTYLHVQHVVHGLVIVCVLSPAVIGQLGLLVDFIIVSAHVES